MPLEEAVAQLLDPAFWASVTPLPVDAMPGKPIPVDAARCAEAREAIRRDGYLQLPPLVSPGEIRALLDAVMAIRAAGLPPVFVFALDPTWHLFFRLDALWTAVFDGAWRALPSCWAWVVEPGERGWKPHQDRQGEPGLAGDAGPTSLSAWIPLTPATPLNGCMYILPMRYHVGDATNVDLQDIRALPAAPGSVLAWNHVVTHWGGRAAENAPVPRVSLSLELQRADARGLHSPAYGPDEIPDLPGRLALIGRMLIRYDHMSPLARDLEALAHALVTLAPEHGLEAKT